MALRRKRQQPAAKKTYSYSGRVTKGKYDDECIGP
jgi:hypothetical protein